MPEIPPKDIPPALPPDPSLKPDAASSNPKPFPKEGGGSGSGGAQTLNDLLDQCTPEQRKKFFDNLCQNIAKQIDKDNKKIIQDLKKQRNPDNDE